VCAGPDHGVLRLRLGKERGRRDLGLADVGERRREAINRAENQIQREEQQHSGKPPGVINIEQSQAPIERTFGGSETGVELVKLLDVLLWN